MFAGGLRLAIILALSVPQQLHSVNRHTCDELIVQMCAAFGPSDHRNYVFQICQVARCLIASKEERCMCSLG